MLVNRRISRILGCFEKQLVRLNAERILMYKDQGFFGMPVLRLFAYFVTRLKLIENYLSEASDFS